MVAENYREVEEKVKKACERSGRRREEVTLIAVSKTKPEPPREQERRFLPQQAWAPEQVPQPGRSLLPGQPEPLRQSPRRKRHNLFHSLLLKIYAFSYPPNF